MDTWDTAELDARLAGAEGRAPAVFPANGCSPKLLRLPGEAGVPRTRIVTRRRDQCPAAKLAEVRRLRRAGVVSLDEARAMLGLPPLPWHRHLLRALRRVRWL